MNPGPYIRPADLRNFALTMLLGMLGAAAFISSVIVTPRSPFMALIFASGFIFCITAATFCGAAIGKR